MTLRGYESGTVDAHIRMLADEYEILEARAQEAIAQSAAAPAPVAVADTASDQVRFIIEATEKSVAEMKQKAEAEAEAHRAEAYGELERARIQARGEVDRARAEASQQARMHVANVAQVAHGLLSRVEVMEREIATLLEGMRGGSARVSAELAMLQTMVGDVRATTVALNTDLPLDAPALQVAPPAVVLPTMVPGGSVAPPPLSVAPPAGEPMMFATSEPQSAAPIAVPVSELQSAPAAVPVEHPGAEVVNA